MVLQRKLLNTSGTRTASSHQKIISLKCMMHTQEVKKKALGCFSLPSVPIMQTEENALPELEIIKNLQGVSDVDDTHTCAPHTSIFKVVTVVAIQGKTGAKIQTRLCSTTGHTSHIYWARSFPKISTAVCNSS